MNSWATAWEQVIGLPPGLPHWLIACIALILIFVFVVVPSATIMAFVERKLGADLQARVGPNRAGPAGMFQPIADYLKSLQKRFQRRSSYQENLFSFIHVMALFSSIAVLPLCSMLLLIDADMSAFLPFWAALSLAFGTMLTGLNQATVPGWFGGIRVSAQALAGAFPALLSLLCTGMRAGGFQWSLLATSQGASPFHWAVVSSPFMFIAFLVFIISGLVLLGVGPVDSGAAQMDIHGGVASHLYGRRLTLFNLSRFYGFFLWSVVTVVLFLGAWRLPEAVVSALQGSGTYRILDLLEIGVLLIKTLTVMVLVALISRVTPRIRADQVTDLALKVLSPFALIALAGSALWIGWGALL